VKRLGTALACLLAISAALPLSAEPYRLRIGWVVAGADLGTLMFVKPGLAVHASKSYTPDLIHFEGTSTAMTALATGELDTASLAYSTFALGVQNAGMSDLKVIGDEFQDGVPGYHTNEYRVRNDSPFDGGDREAALLQTFCSTHAVLRATGGAFVSLTDPPPEYAQAAAACVNEGVWPVLAGDPGDRSTVLASPIILEDHPQIAPESPGDLFDGGEIDQMLVLNILSLTEEERRDMRDADPRTREILERTEALSPEELMRLHGAIREFGMVRR